jgi:hypothetical protein
MPRTFSPPSPSRSARGMSPPLDEGSRRVLRTFAGQVALLGALGVPALLIDSHAPALFLHQLRTAFGLSALVVFMIGVVSRQRLERASLGIWDHVAALLLLQSGCSAALRLLG